MTETSFTDNKFPNCLSFDLYISPYKANTSLWNLIKSFFQSSPTEETEECEVKLTINFGTETLNILGGTVTFGINRGILRLKLTNGTIPLDKIRLTSQFQLGYEREIQKESGQENEINATFSKILSVITQKKQASKSSTKIKDIFYAIANGGTKENRTWTFRTPEIKYILEGILQNEIIAILQVSQKPIQIEALFEVKDEDIKLTEATGFWARDIGRNKLAWIDREILLSYIRPKLQPYLSRRKINYE